jgi:hypothetical protein
MAKTPAFAKAFSGRWRIVEMDVWDNDFLDLVEEAHLTFTGEAGGEIAFGALRGPWMSAMAHAMVRPVPSSRGKATTITIRRADAGGLRSAQPVDLSVTSTSTTATIQASSASPTDLFNSLLVAIGCRG